MRSPIGPIPPLRGGIVLHNFLEISQAGLVTGFRSAVESRPFVRRQLSPAEGRALEMLGHAIEYLADEYCADSETKGRFGSADPRIEAIQTLKRLNREIYYAAAEVQPAFTRIKQWVMGSPPV
jgi:hypothetical protein